jgi:hypothetical protein
MATSVATVGEVTRRHLFEDLRRASKETSIPPDLCQEIVVGSMLQLLGAFAEGRLSPSDRESAVGAILRAIGVKGRRVKSTLARLTRIERKRAPPMHRKKQKAGPVPAVR